MLQELRVFTHFVRGPLMGCLPHRGHQKNSAGPQGRAVCLPSLHPASLHSPQFLRSKVEEGAQGRIMLPFLTSHYRSWHPGKRTR